MRLINIVAISFFFSAWGDRLWTFAVGLYLVKLTPGSLQLAAIYGLVLTSSAILFSPVIGEWIDRTNRLKSVRLLLFMCNLFIILCAVVILVYLRNVPSFSVGVAKTLQALIIILGSLANLSGVGEKICVSKDWIVVLSKSNKDTLSKANALFRRIDLSVAILAPVGVGLLMSVVSDLAGIVFICAWDVVTMIVEYLLLLFVYNRDSDLSKKKTLERNTMITKSEREKPGSSKEVKVHVINSSSSASSLDFIRRLKNVLFGWRVYQRQPVVLAGVALAWLYLTVLGFNAITTSYAYSQGLKELYVSICYGLGSFFGIVGTFLFPRIRNKIGLAKTGLIGNIMQVCMLSMCIISVWLPGSPSSLFIKQQHINTTLETYTQENNSTKPVASENIFRNNPSIVMFMAGIIFSRAGLWIADLTITQLQQEYVPEAERGTVGGVQFALNSCFNLLHYVITSALPYPNQFWILIMMSVFAVISSFVTYVVFNISFNKRENYEQLK